MQSIDITTNYPAPSCTIKNIIWDEINKSWLYKYEIKIDSDFKVSEDEDFKEPLCIYGHIHQLKLVNKVTKNSINISVKNIEEVKALIKKQAEQDNLYRENWIKENPNYYDDILTQTVENKTQEIGYSNIIGIMDQTDTETTFIVAIKKKGTKI